MRCDAPPQRLWSRHLAPLAIALSVVTAFAAVQESSQIPSLANDGAGGYRLWVLLFDVSSMQTDEVTRAKAAAIKWIDTGMSEDDMVSVVTIGTSLKLVENFTMNVPRVRAAVTAVSLPPAPGAGADQALLERDLFNNDLRLRGLRTLCTGLRVIPQKKALMYFTATHDRPGLDNQVELLATTDACNQARVTINTLDVHIGGGER
jgi:hypothetical protein